MITLILALSLGQSCGSPFVCTTGSNLIEGQTVFYDLTQAYGSYSYGSREASFISINDILLGGALVPVLDNGAIILLGSRVDGEPGGAVIINNEHYTDTGGSLSVFHNGVQVLVSDAKGNLITGGAPLADGGTTDVLHTGMIIIGNTASGAIAMQSAPGGRISFEYRLGENCPQLVDAGVAYGDCLDYAGKHGGFEISSAVPMKQGWAFLSRNPGGIYGDDTFAINVSGAYGTVNCLNRANFLACPAPFRLDSFGQEYPGASPGMHQFACDEDRSYLCTSTGWKKEKLECDP